MHLKLFFQIDMDSKQINLLKIWETYNLMKTLQMYQFIILFISHITHISTNVPRRNMLQICS